MRACARHDDGGIAEESALRAVGKTTLRQPDHIKTALDAGDRRHEWFLYRN
jgi:hypothetical protein